MRILQGWPFEPLDIVLPDNNGGHGGPVPG
jgi:hypothetical protein